MADIRESFPILEDGSGIGTPLTKSQAGDAATGKVGLTSFSFRDSSGNLVLPQLDSEGRLVVTSDAAGTPKKANGELAAGSLTIADVTGASISLTVNKTYVKVSATVACLRDSLFQIVHVDNLSTNILAEVIVASGQFTFTWNQPGFEILAGASGTQTFKVQAKNFDKASSLRATISAIEVP